VKAVIIGGGLAGITAAVALANAGTDVTLLEAKPRLGGATMSFSRDGLVVDTGQHVFLRCCTAYRGLLDRLGVAAHAPLQPRFDVTVLTPGGRARLRRARMPAPLHLGSTLARYAVLSLPERMSVTRAALAFRTVDPADPEADATRLGDWMRAHGQSEHARRALWDLFTIATLNVPGDEASLALAAKVVRTGLLEEAGAADIGVPALPLGELHGTAAQRKLTSLGADIRLNTKVVGIEALAPAGSGPASPGDGPASSGPTSGKAGAQTAPPIPEISGMPRFRVLLGRGSGEAIEADAVVLAVPHEAAARLIPPEALPEATVSGWSGLGAAPIVNVHVIYDRKVMDLPFAAGVDSPVQWVFDRTRISGMHARGDEGQYLAISLSAADQYVDQSVAELRERFVPALAELLPAAREARVTEFFVTRERRATFRQVPGSARLRPKAATGLPGLVLAGSWTDTGWPDTMEGAVRSGLNAVRALGPLTSIASQGGARDGGSELNEATAVTAEAETAPPAEAAPPSPHGIQHDEEVRS
jgi:uncharacterized protein with NAD-binding domain and iron-sulfur cluster